MFTPSQTATMIRATGGVRVRYTPAEGEPVTTWGHRDTADAELLEDLRQGAAGVKGVKAVVRIATGILPELEQETEVEVETARDSGAYETFAVRDASRLDDGGITRVALATPRGVRA